MRDDAIAILALLVGGTLAFIGHRQWILLSSGIAMASGGAVLALRGQRSIVARGWLRSAILLGGMAMVGSMMLDLYAEWIAGQWLAEGMRDSARDLRRVALTAAALRSVGAFLSFSFLFGALVSRFTAPEEKPEEKRDDVRK